MEAWIWLVTAHCYVGVLLINQTFINPEDEQRNFLLIYTSNMYISHIDWQHFFRKNENQINELLSVKK